MKQEDMLPREERVKRVNALLRQVDEDVRKNDLEGALEKIRKVYHLDIKNIYARAYEERILVKMLDKERSQIEHNATAKAEGQVEHDMKKWIEEFQQHQAREERSRRKLETLDADLEQRARAAALSEIMERVGEVENRLAARMEEAFQVERSKFDGNGRSGRQGEVNVVIDPTGKSESIRIEYEEKIALLKQEFEDNQRVFRQETFEKLSAEHRKTEEELLRQIELDREMIAGREAEKLRNTVQHGYSSVLTVMMQLAVTETTQHAIISAMQASFNIGTEDHATLLSAAKQQVYANAIRSAWQHGKPSAEDQSNLDNLAEHHGITEAEKAATLQRVRKELGLADENAVILAIDDDPIILKFIEHALKQTYRTVLTATDVPSALQIIEKQQPALILCDVQMPSIGGFTFFERITAGMYGDELKSVPFLFMSSLTDDFFIRSACQLGVESYVTKPFTREILEQTVRQATS